MGVLLIGGSSHTGKSTAAAMLGRRLGRQVVSTDSLGRHPGRPWSTAPAIAEHYRSMATDALVADVLAHYARLWPQIDALIGAGEDLIIEGSALWPETVAARALAQDGVAAAWLTARPETLRARIHAESGYSDADAGLQALIDSFAARTLRYDALMMEAVRRLALVSVAADDGAVGDRLLALLDP